MKLSKTMENYRRICEELQKEIDKFDINELKKEEAGQRHEFIDLNSAVADLIAWYEQDEIQHYFPSTKKIVRYKGKDYTVALVLGDVEITETFEIITKDYGARHFMKKHGQQIVDKKKFTLKNMETALLNFNKALESGSWYIDKDYTDRLAITYGNYLYIICLATDETELTYLHNLFVPENQYRQQYLDKKHKIDKKDIEIIEE